MDLIRNARVVTLDPAAPSGRAVVVDGGRVVRVEPEDRAARAGEEALDAAGAVLVPAFHDAHVHLSQTGLALGRVALGGARSRDELLARLDAALDGPRDSPFLVGEGADESGWADARLPERADLDRLSRDVPIVARRVCTHKAVANGAALALIAAARREGGGDGAGAGAPFDSALIDSATGLLLEDAAMSLDARVLAPRPEDRVPAILRGARHALAHGIAAADEITSWPSVLAYLSLAEEGRLPIRITLHILYEDLPRARALGWRTGTRVGPGGRLAIGGIKLFADGSLGARTAALREPYADAPDTRGLLLLDAATLAARVAEIERAGFRALVHAIGDAAIDAALSGFEAAAIAPGNPLGHRLEHVELVPDAAAVDRLARLGLAVAAQPNFVGAWQGDRGMYATRLGRDRARRLNPFATLIRAGVPLAFSSDGMPIDPLFGIRSAARHPEPSERVEPLEAFRRYAEWGSRIAGEPPPRGRVTPGAPADFALLSASPEEIAGAAGGDGSPAQVLATIVDGALAHDARDPRNANPS